MAQVASPSSSMVASPTKHAKIELNRTQAYDILENLSLLAYDAHKHNKLNYTLTSVTLGTSSGTLRKGADWLYYLAGSQTTTEIVSLLPLINKVHNFITKNPAILTEYSERNLCMGKVDKAVQGLEALKTNQYDKQDDKKKLIDKSIDVLKTIKTVLETTQAENTRFRLEEGRQRRLEEEARQKERDELSARLKEENRILRIQVAAAGGTKDLSPEQLISLAQDCLKLISSKMNEAKAEGVNSLRKTTT